MIPKYWHVEGERSGKLKQSKLTPAEHVEELVDILLCFEVGLRLDRRIARQLGVEIRRKKKRKEEKKTDAAQTIQ